MSRFRVLVVSDVFPPRHGGSGRWLWELFQRVPGVEANVVAGRAPGDAEFDRMSPFRTSRFAVPFASWGVMDPRGARSYISAVRQVRRLIAEHVPGALHAGKCLPEGLVALAARGGKSIPVLCFAHGEELTLAQKSRELRFLTHAVLSRTSQVVANSKHTRQLLVAQWGVDPGKIVVLPPGVDTSRFVPAPRDAEARARLGWTGRRVIVTVGALQRRKGQDMLIRALPEIRRQCPDVLYAIVGEGWERDYLTTLARDLAVDDLVRFLGVADDAALVEAYQQCDLFALPNRRIDWDLEGFGIVLIEAQACGKAVVTGDSGGTIETVIPGETGEVVSCDEPGVLAETCAALLRDPARCEQLGARGRTWVVDQFDWAVVAKRASQLFLYP